MLVDGLQKQWLHCVWVSLHSLVLLICIKAVHWDDEGE